MIRCTCIICLVITEELYCTVWAESINITEFMLVFRIRTRAWLKTSGAVYMENLPFRCGTDWVKGQKPEDRSKDTTSVALCWLFCFALFSKYNSVANTKTKGCWLTGGTICCAAYCFLNVLFCCKQWSEVIRVQCDMGNVHLFLKTATKFGVSIRNNKRNALRPDHFRPSVRPYLCQVSSISN